MLEIRRRRRRKGHPGSRAITASGLPPQHAPPRLLRGCSAAPDGPAAGDQSTQARATPPSDKPRVSTHSSQSRLISANSLLRRTWLTRDVARTSEWATASFGNRRVAATTTSAAMIVGTDGCAESGRWIEIGKRVEQNRSNPARACRTRRASTARAPRASWLRSTADGTSAPSIAAGRAGRTHRVTAAPS